MGLGERAGEVDTRGAVICREEDGTIVVRVKHVDITAEVMREILDGRFSLGRVKARVLIDTRAVRSMTREAQELTATDDVVPYTGAIALVVASSLSVVLANLYVVFVRPRFPTKMFRTEEAARAWLSTVPLPER